jgi:chemotaxis protein MotB
LTDKDRKVEDESSKVPGYIVTFSDMTTLLLTFFVLLISLASMQDPEIFNRGRDSFWQSVKYCGLGMLFGKKVTLDFEDIKKRHLIEDPNNKSEGRGIDEQREKIQKILVRLSRSMVSMPSQIVAEKVNFAVTNIRFPHGEAALDQSAERFLTDFCLTLRASTAGLAESRKAYSTSTASNKVHTLYVLGLGDNTSDSLTESRIMGKKQWILSAKRAKAVVDFLETVLSPNDGWSIYSWGAGQGGQWIGEDSPMSRQSHIHIAVLQGK